MRRHSITAAGSSRRVRRSAHRRPRVLHVAPLFFGDDGMWGGGERYALELARHTAQHVPTRLVTFGPRARRVRDGDLDIHMLPLRRRYRGNDVNPISELLPVELLAGEVIHSHHYHSIVTNLCVLEGRATSKRVFVTDHNSSGRNFAHKLRLDKWVDGLLAVSDFAAGRFPQFSDRHTTIYGGVDTNVFRPNGDEPRGDVLFVGRLHYFKGVDVLIDAVRGDTRLDLYGPSYDPDYLQVLHQHARGKNAVFHPPPSQGDLVRAYQEARVAVLPSTSDSRYGAPSIGEFFPLVILEAMACGTPVVATNVGGIPEIVQHGENGFVVPPNDPAALADAVAEIRADRDLRRRMSKAAVETVRERFTWSAVAQRCIEAYGLA
jgi:glycosyltransferase involved in cell wall biosynthesis